MVGRVAGQPVKPQRFSNTERNKMVRNLYAHADKADARQLAEFIRAFALEISTGKSKLDRNDVLASLCEALGVETPETAPQDIPEDAGVEPVESPF